jgi:hypothetical protein
MPPDTDVIAALTFAGPNSGSARVLDIVYLPDGTAYAAVERVDGPRFPATVADGAPYVTAAVVIRSDKAWPYDMVIQYERHGPRCYGCPARILDLLSPVERVAPETEGREPGPREWAAQWRERCRAAMDVATAA